MHYEVEIKYRITNDDILSFLEANCRLVQTETARDIYFVRNQDSTRYRLRCTNDNNIVTIKSDDRIECAKKYKNIPIKICKEVEYEINDVDSFVLFSDMIGFRIGKKFTKNKRKYTIDNFEFEVNQIDKVGIFFELEILCKYDKINESKDKLVTIFNLFNFNPTNIVTEKYTDFL